MGFKRTSLRRSPLFLEIATAIIFLNLPSQRWRILPRVPSILVCVTLIFAVAMHLFIMSRYWLHKNADISVALLTEAVLYISAACTYPLLLMYLYQHGFRPLLKPGSLTLPCVPFNAKFGAQWLRKMEVEARGIRIRTADKDGSGKIRTQSEVETGQLGVGTPWQDRVKARHDNSTSQASLLLASDPPLSYGAVSFLGWKRSSNYGNVELTLSSGAGDEQSDMFKISGDENYKNFSTTNNPNYSTLWSVGAALIGCLLATTMVGFDLGAQRIFDEADIRHFLKNDSVSPPEKGIYWVYVWFVFYGIYASIFACAIFNALTLVQRRAVKAVAEIIPSKSNLEEARELVDDLRRFLDDMSRSMSWWFLVHNVCFFFLSVLLCYELLEAGHNYSIEKSAREEAMLWGSEVRESECA